MRWHAAWLMLALVVPAWAPAPAQAEDSVTMGTDWLAEAEYGGYYQAVATGIYRKHGLDVTIKQGGPSVNQTQLHAGRPARLQHRLRQLHRAEHGARRTCRSARWRRCTKRSRRC